MFKKTPRYSRKRSTFLSPRTTRSTFSSRAKVKSRKTPILNTRKSRLPKKKSPKVKGENIELCVRIRPTHGVNRSVHVKNNSIHYGEKSYSFPTLYAPSDDYQKDQERICKDLSEGIIENVTKLNMNTCCFCYGQTGSGKTYTMHGNKDIKGIIHHCSEKLLEYAEKINMEESPASPTHQKITIRLSMFEIYKEKINDLLADKNNSSRDDLQDKFSPKKEMRRSVFGSSFNYDEKEFKIMENGEVRGLESEIIENYEECKNILKSARRFVKIGETKRNSRSSRSHVVVKFTIKTSFYNIFNEETKSMTTFLNLIDLAGSEKIKNSKTAGTIKEGISINKSLSTLGLVIKNLAEKRAFVPYRNSKLTYLLKASLEGRSKIFVVLNVQPNNVEETKSSLEFGTRLKMIETKKFDIAELKNFQAENVSVEFEKIKNYYQYKFDEKLDRINNEKMDEVEEEKRRIFNFFREKYLDEKLKLEEQFDKKIKEMENELKLKYDIEKLEINKKQTTILQDIKNRISEIELDRSISTEIIKKDIPVNQKKRKRETEFKSPLQKNKKRKIGK